MNILYFAIWLLITGVNVVMTVTMMVKIIHDFDEKYPDFTPPKKSSIWRTVYSLAAIIVSVALPIGHLFFMVTLLINQERLAAIIVDSLERENQLGKWAPTEEVESV